MPNHVNVVATRRGLISRLIYFGGVGFGLLGAAGNLIESTAFGLGANGII